MKEYPFSGMNPDRALGFFWTEFMAYKESTDRKIATLTQQIQILEQEKQELLKMIDQRILEQSSKADQLREMLDPEAAQAKEERERRMEEAMKSI